MGGNFGGNRCLTNESVPSNATADLGGSATVGAGVLTDGIHKTSSGDLTLNGGTVATGKNPAVYVTGHNVYISQVNGGIRFSAGPWNVTSTTSNVPSFTLVVSGGNIYIDPRVTELDGIYIASKDSAGRGGTIYTCGTAAYQPVAPASSIFGSCGSQLTVYGSFVANQINLMRAYGSLRDSTAGEAPAGSHAAEIFQFTPAIYLSPNPGVPPPSNGALIEQARTSLPPVL